MYKLLEPKSKNEDSKRREFILNVFLVGSVILSGIASFLIIIESLLLGENFRGGSPLSVIVVFLVFLGLYFLSRKGFFIVASYILVAIYFIATTFILYRWGIDLPQGLLTYVLVIVMSSVLISTRFSLVMTVLSASIVLLLGYLQNQSITHPNLYWKQEMLKMEDAIMIAATFGIIAIVSWLSNREIEKSLHRARRSEAELEDERDLLEVRVEKRTEELKRAQREKTLHLYRFAEFGKMASGLFHDLLNPLTVASLNLESLQKREHTSELDDALHGIQQIKQLAEASRKQVQRQEIQTIFSVAEEITLAVHMLGTYAKEANIILEFLPPKDFIQTYGNPIKFYRVITGLLVNAVDAYDGVTREKEKRTVTTTLYETGGMIRVMIQDYGCGIKESDKEKIFEPFFTTKNIEKGTGIGLAICKDIVEKDFGGRIMAESEEGVGTSFIITLPVRVGSKASYE